MKIIGINDRNINIIRAGTRCFKCKYAKAYKEKYKSKKYISVICSKLNKEVVNNYDCCKYKPIMKSEFSIGDIVKTRNDLIEYRKYKGIRYIESMKIISSKIDFIEELYNNKLYKIGDYYYTDEMLEKV